MSEEQAPLSPLSSISPVNTPSVLPASSTAEISTSVVSSTTTMTHTTTNTVCNSGTAASKARARGLSITLLASSASTTQKWSDKVSLLSLPSELLLDIAELILISGHSYSEASSTKNGLGLDGRASARRSLRALALSCITMSHLARTALYRVVDISSIKSLTSFARCCTGSKFGTTSTDDSPVSLYSSSNSITITNVTNSSSPLPPASTYVKTFILSLPISSIAWKHDHLDWLADLQRAIRAVSSQPAPQFPFFSHERKSVKLVVPNAILFAVGCNVVEGLDVDMQDGVEGESWSAVKELVVDSSYFPWYRRLSPESLLRQHRAVHAEYGHGPMMWSQAHADSDSDIDMADTQSQQKNEAPKYVHALSSTTRLRIVNSLSERWLSPSSFIAGLLTSHHHPSPSSSKSSSYVRCEYPPPLEIYSMGALTHMAFPRRVNANAANDVEFVRDIKRFLGLDSELPGAQSRTASESGDDDRVRIRMPNLQTLAVVLVHPPEDSFGLDSDDEDEDEEDEARIGGSSVPRSWNRSFWTRFGMVHLSPTSAGSSTTNSSLSSSLLSTPSSSSHLGLSSYPFSRARSRRSTPATSDSEPSYPYNDDACSSEDEDDDDDDSLTLSQRLAKVQRACTKRRLQKRRNPSTLSTNTSASLTSASSPPKLVVLHVSSQSEEDSWKDELRSYNNNFDSPSVGTNGKRKRMNAPAPRNRFGQLKRLAGEGFWEWVGRAGV